MQIPAVRAESRCAKERPLLESAGDSARPSSLSPVTPGSGQKVSRGTGLCQIFPSAQAEVLGVSPPIPYPGADSPEVAVQGTWLLPALPSAGVPSSLPSLYSAQLSILKTGLSVWTAPPTFLPQLQWGANGDTSEKEWQRPAAPIWGLLLLLTGSCSVPQLPRAVVDTRVGPSNAPLGAQALSPCSVSLVWPPLRSVTSHPSGLGLAPPLIPSEQPLPVSLYCPLLNCAKGP